MDRTIMIKIGGSLMVQNDGKILRQIGNIITGYSPEHPILIVPGGGPFADIVRQYGEQFELSEKTCHFMALTSMDQYAYLLNEIISGSILTDLSNMESSTTTIFTHPQVPHILLCSAFIRQVCVKDLPHSWDVTSDSIALYLAKLMDISMLVILKSTDVDLTLQEPDVDLFFQQLLPVNIPVWFLNGIYSERLADLLQTGTTKGIYLAPNSLCGEFVP